MSTAFSNDSPPGRIALGAPRLAAAAALGGAMILALAAPALAQGQYGDDQGGPPPSRQDNGYQDNGYQGGPPPGGQYGDRGAPSPRGAPSEARFVQMHIRHVMRADANGDGRVSQAEWMAWRAPRSGPEAARREFMRLDVNHQGFLTPDELRRHEERLYSHLLARRGGPGGPAGGYSRDRGYGAPGQGGYPQGPADQDGPG